MAVQRKQSIKLRCGSAWTFVSWYLLSVYWATFFVSKLSRSKLIKPRKLSTFLETVGLSCPHSTLNVHLDDKHCITIMVLLRDDGYLNQFVRCNRALSATLLSAYWSQPGATFQEGHFLSSYLHLLLSTIPSFLYLGSSFPTYFYFYMVILVYLSHYVTFSVCQVNTINLKRWD